MEIIERKKGAYIIFDTEEEYLQLLFAAKEMFQFKGNSKKTCDKYINMYISAALKNYIAEFNENNKRD